MSVNASGAFFITRDKSSTHFYVSASRPLSEPEIAADPRSSRTSTVSTGRSNCFSAGSNNT